MVGSLNRRLTYVEFDTFLDEDTDDGSHQETKQRFLHEWLGIYFRKQHLNERLTYGLQRVFVDVLHVIADGVPCRTERALCAIGIIRYDVDGGDVGFLIHGNMIVGDISAISFREETSISRLTARDASS